MDKKVLKQGYADIRLRVSGMLQKHRFTLKTEKSAFGNYYLLETGVPMPSAELVRSANEVGFPLRSPTGLFFPPGKGPKDFLVGGEG
jgi:hypothetical protein